MDIIGFEGLVRAKFGTKYRKGKSKNGLEFKICCPFCPSNGKTPDTGYKLWINPARGMWRCWRCNESGTLRKLFGQMDSLPEVDPQVMDRTRKVSNIMPGSSMIPMQDLDDDHLASRYMRDRGFNPQAMGICYGLYYCETGKKFAGGMFDTSNTIIFPIWMGGEVVGWQSRLLYNPDSLTAPECEAFGLKYDADKGKFIKPPKYFTSPGLTKGDVLYNFDVARESNVVVVVEGPTDVLATGPAAVGTLGKGVSDRQVEMMKGWDLVIIMLDPGDADRETMELVHKLSTTVPTIPVRLTGMSDPGSGTTAEIWRQIAYKCAKAGYPLSNYNLGPRWSKKVFKRN